MVGVITTASLLFIVGLVLWMTSDGLLLIPIALFMIISFLFVLKSFE